MMVNIQDAFDMLIEQNRRQQLQIDDLQNTVMMLADKIGILNRELKRVRAS